MAQYDYPTVHGKLVVLMGGFTDVEACGHWYFDQHVRQLTVVSEMTEYLANIVTDRLNLPLTRETNGEDPYGVQAVDEIKGVGWNAIKGLYHGSEVLGVYSVTEYMIRELHADRQLGIRSPEIKRIALLTKPQGKTHEEAMRYWLEQHPKFCFRHHTGMASYSQNHIDAKLTENSLDLDGFPILTYWNEDALAYGHFSMQDSQRLMLEDCRHFRSSSFVVTVDEYVMKRSPRR